MILLNALVGLFAIFVSPQLFLYRKFPNINYSLLLIYGFIASLTGTWMLFLISFYLNIPNWFIATAAYIVAVVSIAPLFLGKSNRADNKVAFSRLSIWAISIIVLMPLLYRIGSGFTSLDAAASWNRWAIELYNNIYNPIDAAYPLLLPSLWSIIYKIQNSNDIWWTSQVTLFLIPLFTIAILSTLFTESKNLAYPIMGLLLYPYLISSYTINGDMDMPVMLIGFLSLISLYAAECNRGKIDFDYYSYASLLLAGLASITKQAGLAFLAFTILYIVLNRKHYRNKRVLFTVILLSFAYFASFLPLFYLHGNAGAVDNITHLENLSNKGGGWHTLLKNPKSLYDLFFLTPRNITFMTPFLSVKALYTYLIILGYLLFAYKDLRKYSSISFLSALFFMLGVAAWIKFFSYDFRNSLWTRAFFILFVSINLGYLFRRLHLKPIIFQKIILSLLVLVLLFVTIRKGDEIAFKIQKKGQIEVSHKPELAKYAASLLKNKKSCCKIYTNELALPYNYYVKEFQKKGQFAAMGRDYKYQNFSYLEHNCTDGSYMILRDTSMRMDEWWKVQKILGSNLIKEIRPLIYYIPPGLRIEKKYFNLEGKPVYFTPIHNITKDIKFSIETLLKKKEELIIRGWAFVAGQDSFGSERFIVFKNRFREYIFTMATLRLDKNSGYFTNKMYINSGFLALINTKTIKKGSYDLYLLIRDRNKNQHLEKTSKHLEI